MTWVTWLWDTTSTSGGSEITLSDGEKWDLLVWGGSTQTCITFCLSHVAWCHQCGSSCSSVKLVIQIVAFKSCPEVKNVISAGLSTTSDHFSYDLGITEKTSKSAVSMWVIWNQWCVICVFIPVSLGHRYGLHVDEGQAGCDELVKSTLCLCLLDFTILFRTINFVYSIGKKKSFLGVCTRVWQAAQNSLYSLQMPLFALNLDELTSLRKQHIGNFIYNSIKLNCLKLIYINEKIKTFWFRKHTKLSKTGDLLFTNQNHKCAHQLSCSVSLFQHFFAAERCQFIMFEWIKICLWSRYLSYNYPIHEQKHRLLIPVFARRMYFSRSCSRVKNAYASYSQV